MLTDDFDYHLPSERIAQRSVEPRDHSRLLVVDRQTHGVDDRHFYDLPSLLHPGDLLVLNDTGIDQNILVASTSGANVFTLARTGNLTLTSSTSTADILSLRPFAPLGPSFAFRRQRCQKLSHQKMCQK